MPFQWNISIDNSIGGRSTLRAFAVVGAANLPHNSSRYFHGFIEIGKIKGSGLLFDVTITLSITNDRTDANKKLRLPMKQLILESSAPP